MPYKIIEFFLIVIPLGGWLFFRGGNPFLGSLGVLLYYFYVVAIIRYRFESIQSKNKQLLKNLESSNKVLNKKNNELIKEVLRGKILKKKLKKSATHDPLTKLPNRLLLKDRLDQAILRCKREGGKFGILFMDLDHFKPINDTYGHEVGDKLLQEASKRLKKTLRAEDTVSRIGGDEFVVLIPHLVQEKDIDPIAEKVIQNLSVDYQINGKSLRCTISMGIAIFPTGGVTSGDLMRHADLAMYKAKNGGGARFSVYSPQSNRKPR